MAWDGSSIEKEVAVVGTNEAIVKEFMENCIRDETETPAKTIIFAVSKNMRKGSGKLSSVSIQNIKADLPG